MVMKKQLLPFLTVLALMAGIVSVGAQSKLTITPAGNHAIVSWPAGATNYVLQTATNLTSSWSTITTARSSNVRSPPDSWYSLSTLRQSRRPAVPALDGALGIAMRSAYGRYWRHAEPRPAGHVRLHVPTHGRQS